MKEGIVCTPVKLVKQCLCNRLLRLDCLQESDVTHTDVVFLCVNEICCDVGRPAQLRAHRFEGIIQKILPISTHQFLSRDVYNHLNFFPHLYPKWGAKNNNTHK